MLAAEGKVVHVLVLQTGIFVVRCAALGLHAHFAFVGAVFQQLNVLVANAEAVFPVFAVGHHGREEQRVAGSQAVVRIDGQILAQALYVVHANLVVGHQWRIAGKVPLHFVVIGSKDVVLARSTHHQTQAVVGKTIGVRETAVQRSSLAQGVVLQPAVHKGTTSAHCGTGNQIDGTANGVGIHIWGQRFVHLQRLNHVRSNQVQLDVPVVALCGRNALAVDGYAVQLRSQAAHNDVAGLALVVLHGDAAHALQRVANVVVRETSHLVRRHHVGGVDVARLLVDGLGLTLQVRTNNICFRQGVGGQRRFQNHVRAGLNGFGYFVVTGVFQYQGVRTVGNFIEAESTLCIGVRFRGTVEQNDRTGERDVGLVNCNTGDGLLRPGRERRGRYKHKQGAYFFHVFVLVLCKCLPKYVKQSLRNCNQIVI